MWGQLVNGLASDPASYTSRKCPEVGKDGESTYCLGRKNGIPRPNGRATQEQFTRFDRQLEISHDSGEVCQSLSLGMLKAEIAEIFHFAPDT